MKKLLLTFCLLLTALGSWAHDFEVDGIYYNITSADNLTVAVTFRGDNYRSYTNEYTGSVTIPETVTYNEKNYSVTVIGSDTFNGCTGLTSITIPNSVIWIGSYAFSDCNGLTSVTINSNTIASAEYEGSRTLSSIFGSQVTKYDFGEGVTKIGDCACYNCKGLTSVTIGNSVTSIGNRAFIGCRGLTSVTIGNSVTSIGNQAFRVCSRLTKAEFASIESLCRIKFADHTANPLSTTKHLYIKGEEVKDVVIPMGVKNIGNYAFYNCSGLTSVTLLESVTSIGDSAFYDCSSLKSATIPSNVTYIGSSAFYGCGSLTSATIPSSVETIVNNAFEGCTGVNTLKVGATNVSSNLFGLTAANIKEVSILDGVEEIEADAFKDCTNLERCSFESVEGLLNIKFGNGYANPLCQNKVLNIGDKIVTELAIPESIMEVKDYALFNCKSLKSVTEGANVKTIGVGAFSGNTKLNKVVLGSKVEKIGNTAFSQCPLTSIIIPNSVTSIGNYAFDGCSGLTSVTIGNGVTSIGESAFNGCSGLTSLAIPSSVETISDNTFEGCTGVNVLKVGATNVSSNLFGLTAANLKEVSILDGVKEIGADAFKDCTNLERCSFESVEGLLNIKFGNGYANPLCQNKVLNIGDKIVSELAIPESITEVKDYALFNCRSLKSVTEGDNVKTIGIGAFSGNTKLNKVVLGSKVEKIGNTAFSQCPLTSIYSYAEVPPTCGNNVFTMNAEDCKLYVPSASISRYQNHQDWYEFDIQPMISTFKLTYVVDGEVYKTFTVDSGSTLTAEPDPYKEGYTFSGWSEIPETMPDSDVVVTGSFTVNTYKVTYVVDGEEYKTDSIDYGTVLTPETEPTREGYTFSGWSEIPETMPANDVVVTGSFTINTYKVTYMVDGEEYKTDSIDYGTVFTPESEPTKEGYTFSGWSEIPETMPANDVVVTGSFTVNTYQVTFMYGEEVLKVDSVEYGAVIVVPESLDSERYTLIEWLDVPDTMPAHDLTIYASYTDGIEMIKNENKNEEGIYDLNGRKLSQMQKGINIIRMKDGTIRKVLIK